MTANAQTLTVHIRSFSYKDSIPKDPSGNGGGYVFDCRGILNPGRFAEYKTQTGRDANVKEFLERQTAMPQFLDTVATLVSISLEDYINRGFQHLDINFGCTGGQHRSVYAADWLTNYVQHKFPQVQVVTEHVVQERKNWINHAY
ncbi:MAG: RNase adapter RapZ [Weeksellaceae bacterium]|nr:RNase adapter RapZ [Weeksellaceae bacterium]